MEHHSKKILYIGLGLVLIFGLILVVTSYFDQGNRSEKLTSIQIPPQQKEVLLENKPWMSFDSKKDTGLTLGVQFNYPGTWLQHGSRDSGVVSVVPFFDKNKYSKKCESANNGSVSCTETGVVARVIVSNSSYTVPSVTYEDQNNEKITIDGQVGAKISGVVKSESLSHVASVGQRETRAIVTRLDGQQYEFVMITENSTQDELFNEIIKTTKFGNK